MAEGRWSIRVPKGTAAEFQKRLDPLIERWQTTRNQRIYVVQKGDNLSAISERFDVPLPALLIWNRLNPARPIRPGDRLIIAPDHGKE